MTDFYQLGMAERTARYTHLAVEALKQWGVVDCEPRPVKIRENAVFRVSAPDGTPAVLRIHRHGYHTDAALASELQWLQAMRDDGMTVPGVVPAQSGALYVLAETDSVPETRQVDMLTWLEGAPLGSLEKGLSAGVTDIPGTFREVGRTIARLHEHASTWPLPAGFVRHAWDADGIIGAEPLWGRFWEAEILTTAERDLLQTARAAAGKELAEYGQPPRTYGLIHADHNLDNFVVDGARIYVIDFDDTGFGWHQFDLATITIFFRGEDGFDAIWKALIGGYREIRALRDDDLDRMLLFYLLRAFTYLGWIHTRHETATAQEISPVISAQVCGLAAEYLRERG